MMMRTLKLAVLFFVGLILIVSLIVIRKIEINREGSIRLTITPTVLFGWNSMNKNTSKILTSRMERITEYCKKKNWTLDYHMYNLYYFPELDLTWCPSFKAGSSTWRDFFLDQTKRWPKGSVGSVESLLNQLDGYRLYANDYTPKTHPWQPKDKNVGRKSFTQVRHPMNRLLSFYRAQVDVVFDQAMFWFGMEAITRYRRLPDHLKDRFKEFKAELHSWSGAMKLDKRKPPSYIDPDNLFLHPPHPMLNETVEWMKWQYETRHFIDGHWYPANEWCNICQSNLTYIIKLENSNERQYMLQQFNMDQYQSFFSERHNYGPKLFNSDPYEELKTLNSDQRQWLKYFYKNEFELFNYDSSMLD